MEGRDGGKGEGGGGGEEWWMSGGGTNGQNS